MYQEQLVFSLKSGDTLTVTNANIWQGGLEFEQAVSSEGSFELGATHIGQMTVSLADLPSSRIENAVFSLNSDGHLMLNGNRVTYQSVYTNVDFVDATIVLSMAKDSDTLQQIDVYTVVKCTRDNGVINLTAYDNMNKLSEPYTTALTFPTTYGDMANEICGRTMTFDGSTTAVATKPEGEDLTKREVLGYIAQACGYNVLCDSNGQFQFVRYDLPGFSTSGSYHVVTGVYDLHHSQYPVTITGVKVIVHTIVDSTDAVTGEVTSQDVTREYTAGTDDYQLVIEDNPLITTANGQAVADSIFATYGGVSFYTGTVSHVSDLSMKASDIMKVTDRTGTTFNMLVSAVRFSTGAAQSTGSYAEEPTSKTSVQPTETSRLQTSIRQAQIEARNSRQLANNTNQYFWHTQSGSDTGAHITEIPREDFLADPANGGANLLARSNGVAIRDGLTEIAQFTGQAVSFYDGLGNAQSNILASFGANGLILGNDANTRVVIDTSNGLKIGNKVQIAPNGNATMSNVNINSGTISGFTIRKNIMETYYPTYSDGEIRAIAANDISVNDTTHITTVNNDTTVSYTFPASLNGSSATYIYYSPIYSFMDDEDVEMATTSIQYIDENGNLLGGVQYRTSYRTSGYWYAWLDQNIVPNARWVKVDFTLMSGATIVSYIGYGTSDALTYNTSKFLEVSDTRFPSVYLGTNGISVSDKIGLSPTGAILADTLSLHGSGTVIELTDNNKQKRILITNTAYDLGKTYEDDGVYPHACYLYGGSSSEKPAFGAYDVRNGVYIWRYYDHQDEFWIHSTLKLNNDCLPLRHNALSIGSSSMRWSQAYIKNVNVGLADYSYWAGVSCTWADGESHFLALRDSDGLTTYFGYLGDEDYITRTTLRGQIVRFITSKGTVVANDLFKTSGEVWNVRTATGGFCARSNGSLRFNVAVPHIVGTLNISSISNLYVFASDGTVFANNATVNSGITVVVYDGNARIIVNESSLPAAASRGVPLAIEALVSFFVT